MLRSDEPFIFVSYAREDIDAVRPEIKRIESLGYRIWYDIGELTPGYIWNEVIQEAIAKCSCFIVFMTRAAVRSGHVMQEVHAALNVGKPFVHIYWEKVKFPSPLQDTINRIQGLERYYLPTSEYQERLNKALSEHIHPNGAAPPAGQQKGIDDKNPALVLPATPPGVSPKLIFFILTLAALFFALLAVVAMVTPFLGTQQPGDPLNNRLAGFLAGGFFLLIAAGLGVAAIIVRRKYLRRNSD
ncbi:MAG TPA: toll/interleukin-1 receptor domain-containing protein [Blastocatellia bacterium]|nr:toll/interleukin-1 receptor domain-containing protein [Blastocatellia bacterium]